MSKDENLLLNFTAEQLLEIEVQAAGAGMAVRDYAAMLLREAIMEMREDQDPPAIVH